MNMRLQFTITPDDYCEFQRAYMKHRRSLTPRSHRGLGSPLLIQWMVVLVLVVCIFVTIFWLSPESPPVPAPAAPPTSLPLSEMLLALLTYLILFILIWGAYFWRRRSRLLFRRMAALDMRINEERTAEITDAQLTIRETDAYSEMQWMHFIRCIETPSTFLLFVVPRMAHILPKRAFGSDDAIREFRAFAQAHIGNQPIGFPVLPAKNPKTADRPGT
jgi:ABC-type multidrug transport system fused ATPase/permease subunit